ncbi:MAG: Fe-S cluster assembly protein SufD [Bacteroidota bacterium]
MTELLAERFRAFEEALGGAAGSPINTLRRKAMDSFLRLGFPTTRHEDWKYTNVSSLVNGQINLGTVTGSSAIAPEDIRKVHFEGLEANIMVFINGRFAPHSSTILTPVFEMEILSFESAEDKRIDAFYDNFGKYADFDKDAFTALNTAFAAQGTFIHVPEGKIVELPVVLHFINDCSQDTVMSQPRNLFVVGKGSSLKVIETYSTIGGNAGFTNTVTEIVVAEGASVEYVKTNDEGQAAGHVGNTHIFLNADSKATTSTISYGGAVTRNNLRFTLSGDRAEARMYGLFIGKGKSLIDNHTVADHQAPATFSDELYKGLMADKSTGVFNGQILVRRAAQQTNAFQSNRNILLSDDASINTKPQLEIFADDVKCSHGATTGTLDEEPLFYLRARGLSEDDARQLLLHAFITEVPEKISIEQVRASVEQRLESFLAGK